MMFPEASLRIDLAIVLSLLLAGSFLLIDVMLPMGMVWEFMYVVAILVALRAAHRRFVWWLATLCSIMTLLAVPLSAELPSPPTVVFNRVAVLLGIWATAFAGAHMRGLHDTVQHREQQLAAANHDLIERTAQAERQAHQLRQLAQDLTQAEQGERNRLAHLLHDHLQQMLVAAQIKLQLLPVQVPNLRLNNLVTDIQKLIDESITATRSLANELYPKWLREQNWAVALKWLSDWMRDKHGLNVIIEGEPSVEPANEAVRVLLFQCVRELLFNVVKHAKVNEAYLKSEIIELDQLRITVLDKGCGFDKEVPAKGSEAGVGGFGLGSVKERLKLIGSQMHVESSPDHGTRVTLLMPLASLEAAPESSKHLL